ncbi:hypothetical protein P171DRAFT_509783 [Karstenula rhodostoma CBS 690.94]|uniref:SET domain-containing protein n=1 Tax=Karstenula rhodostoma CBS 690.94 TaxID=1392251 RepID=A0A9P4PQG8_9PLEO|nr:hypothetical protein P171DRAFT_509783 [Karstenula rhodostoma CBS 690.94]
MDVHDVTDQYRQMLAGAKQNLLKAKKRRGQIPRDREPKDQMYLKFMMNLMSLKSSEQQQQQQHMMHSSFVPPSYLPCTEPLDGLRRIVIRDLQLETHHRGTYLPLRVITPPQRMTAIMVLAEDNLADVVLLQLYQQETEEIREASDIVNVGMTLLVKEPYFKVMASGEYGLRVDHLSDVIHVSPDDPRIPETLRAQFLPEKCSAQSLKMKGNAAIGEKQYWQAIKEYSNALTVANIPDEIEIIKRNRSLAFLKTKQYDAALSDTGFPNFGSEPVEKSLFRAAEALYFLSRFRDSSKVLELLRAKFPNNEQALAVLERVRRRCLEQDDGNYDFKLLQAEAKKLRPPQLDHATYIGPVEIRNTKTKGRGLFVTKAVKAGDLLLCEKAFAHAYAAEGDEGNSKVTLLMNLETKRGLMGGHADLITTITQKLFRNPSVAPSFTTLYHGNYETASTPMVDGQPIVDTFLVERIMSFNVFGCPLSSLSTHKDILSNKSKKEPTAFHSCGIWTQASYINHRCTSNARRSFIGDMMIVRATQDLEANTEVTFWYKQPTGDRSKDPQEVYKNWNFICDCTMCQDAKMTKAAVFSERRKIVEKMKRACDSPNGIQTGQFERLLKALDHTYTQPADEVPRLSLWDPQLLLARVYMARGDMIKGLESVRKVLIALGFIVDGVDASSTSFRVVKWGLVVDHLVETFLHARTAFDALGAGGDSKTAEGYARCAYTMLVGEDTSFESTYAEHLR